MIGNDANYGRAVQSMFKFAEKNGKKNDTQIETIHKAFSDLKRVHKTMEISDTEFKRNAECLMAQMLIRLQQTVDMMYL